MKLEYLEYLVAVADCGSIHEASRKLLLKQQYISGVIIKLEQHFDTTIFDRTPKGVTPTANGAYLIEKARAILDLYGDMEARYLYPDRVRELQLEEDIDLYLPAYLDNESLVTAIDAFNHYYPNVHVNVRSRLPEEGYVQALSRTDRHPLLLYSNNVTAEDLRQKLDPSLVFQELHAVPLMVFTSRSNPAAGKYQTLSIEEALKLNLVVFAPYSLAQSPIYRLLCAHGKPNVAYVVDNPMMLFRLVEKKNCFAIAKKDILKDNPSLVSIPFRTPLTLRLFLICHPQTLQSHAVQSLIRLLKLQQDGLIN